MKIDSFSGTVADMPRKDKAIPIEVLRVLSKHPRYSVWDSTDNRALGRSIEWLLKKDYIDLDHSCGFPWCDVIVTDAGRSALGAK